MREATLRVELASKSFGRQIAVDGVSLTVDPSSVHVLLGPNGAGKTTLIRAALGLIPLDAGRVVLGATRHGGPCRVAYQPEDPALYEYLTVREFLAMALRLAGPANGNWDEDCERLVAMFEMSDGLDKLCRSLSAGMRRKVSLLGALVQRPDLYILDEPTNHLDAVAVRRLKETLRGLRADGRSVLVATHMIDFAATIGDEVTILDRGRVRFSGPLTTVPGDGSLEDRVFAMLEGPGDPAPRTPLQGGGAARSPTASE